MSNPAPTGALVQLVDRVADLIDRAKKGDAFALDDARSELRKLRKALTTTTITALTTVTNLRAGERPRMRRCWRDAVALYKWGQAQVPKGSTLAEIHACLIEQKGKWPGELRHCRLPKRAANFAQYFRAGLAREGARHRDRKAGRA